MSNRRILIAAAFASLLLLGVGYYTGTIFPLPSSFRPAHGDVLTPSGDVRLRAARCVISWIVDGNRVPGYDEGYPDAEIMKRQKRFVVVCPFLADDAVLSMDSRVYRVNAHDVKSVYRKYGFDRTDYIALSLAEGDEQSFQILLYNHFGDHAAHWYTFRFRETKYGLVAEGKCTGVM